MGKTTASRLRFPLRSLFINSLLVLFGIGVALLLMEIFLGFYNPFQTRIKGNRIVLTTNKTYRIKNDFIKALDPHITVTRNSLGFRGPDPPADMAKHLSLVTIGGSTTQCFDTWTALLGKHLERSFSPVWINNAGLDGHSTYGHQVLFEDFIVPLRPHVALFLIGANDVARSSIAEWDAENVKSGLHFSSLKTFVKSLSAYSEVATLSLNIYRSYIAYRAGLIHHAVDLNERAYLDVPAAEQEKYRVENAAPALLKAFEERLKKIVETSKKAGIKPILITQPLLVGFGKDDVTGVDLARVQADDSRHTGKMYWEVLQAYNEVTIRVGRESRIPAIDLAKQMPKSSRYFYDFMHYTPQGAHVVADILARFLCPVLQTDFPEYVTRGCSSD